MSEPIADLRVGRVVKHLYSHGLLHQTDLSQTMKGEFEETRSHPSSMSCCQKRSQKPRHRNRRKGKSRFQCVQSSKPTANVDRSDVTRRRQLTSEKLHARATATIQRAFPSSRRCASDVRNAVYIYISPPSSDVIPSRASPT